MPSFTYAGMYSVVEADLPGRMPEAVGVLLEDPAQNRLYLRFRRDWELLAEEEDYELLTELADDLEQKADEMGAESLLRYLEETLSGTIRITDREQVLVEDFGRALDRLYRKHVGTNVLAFRTHLPRYSLRAAAGRFLENEEISEQGWIETPADLRLSQDMFVAEIAGHSMEPNIPDGSLCVFQAGVTGSREGRLVLAEDRENHAFAVKKYHSEKRTSGEGEWRHVRIRLISLNPEYPSWDLEPDEEKYRILAAFVCVLS